MKKLLVVLLSLGLIVGFSTGVSAATTVQWGGAYEMYGGYDSNPSLGDPGYSRANLWQRVRLLPVWTIAEGLTFTARMDALEKNWGATDWRYGAGAGTDTTSSRKQGSGASQKVQENFEFEQGYADMKTGIGQFVIGYQGANTWGTKFADGSTTRPRVRYQMPFGPITMLVIWEKNIEGDQIAGNKPRGIVDADSDSYFLAGIYKQGSLEAGLMYGTNLSQATRLQTNNDLAYRVKLQTLQPYVKATFGPVYVEAEFDYFFGKSKEYEDEGKAQAVDALNRNVDKKGWGAYGMVQYNMGPAYVGGLIGYMSGDQGDDVTKDGSGGPWKDVNPAMIMGNNDTTDPFPGSAYADGGGIGSITGTTVGFGSKKEQSVFYSIFGGYKVTPKLTVTSAFTMAKTTVKFKNGMTVGTEIGTAGTAVANPALRKEYLSDDIGKEFDVMAAYKVFDNLTYTVGAGYMWTGDFFKGTNPNAKIGDEYQLLHKLTLNF